MVASLSQLSAAEVDHTVVLDEVAVAAYAAVIGAPAASGVAGALLLASRVAMAAAATIGIADDHRSVAAADLVHIAEDVVLAGPLERGRSYRTITAVRHVAASRLGSIVTVGHDVGGPSGGVARITTKLLLRGHELPSFGTPPRRPDRPPSSEGRPFTLGYTVDPDTPARYAEVSGDHNPVHLDAGAARAAGFDRPIVHGMCTLAQTAARLHAAIGPGRPVARISARFAKPVHPGGDVAVAGRHDAGSACTFSARSTEGTCLKTGVLELA